MTRNLRRLGAALAILGGVLAASGGTAAAASAVTWHAPAAPHGIAPDVTWGG